MDNPNVPAGARYGPDWAANHARCFVAAPHPGHVGIVQAQRMLCDGLSQLLAWPFDLLRTQHALAVQSGLWTRSLLESQRFESGLDALERMSLGPLARRV